MRLLLDDIKAALEAAGVGGSADPTWPIFEAYMPDDSDQMIAVFETGGMPRDTLLGENIRPTFQVRVRASKLDYAVARAKWLDVFNALQDSHPTAAYAYVQAMMTTPMHFNDDKGRPNLTVNFRVMKAHD